MLDTGHVSNALRKMGWFGGSLRAGARRGRFVLKVAETPLKITQKFATDLAAGLLDTMQKTYDVHVDQIQWEADKHMSTIAFDVRLQGDKVLLGDVILSASGYTGQVEELEDPEKAGAYPRLARVFWYKFRNIEDNFYSWETADNLHVLDFPLPNQWWPGLNPDMPGHAIPKDRPWNRNPPGTPIHELVQKTYKQEFESMLDKEAELNQCACGCGRTCKKTFAPGHDAKAHKLLKEYSEGKSDGWKPGPKLLKYVTMHTAWREEFQATLSET